MKTAVVAVCALVLCCHAASTNQRRMRSIPNDLRFGTATAAYQIEGAWNEDGKGENVWDRLTHTTNFIRDSSTGDVAADSYHNVERDVEMMRELGLDAYRLSIAWSRLLPTGFPNHVNEHAVNYYNSLFNEMLKYNIEPMVTLYHWDVPQPLQDLGGWANNLMPQWFEDYARVVFDNFGDRVKIWITINEPREVCYQGYGAATMAPAINVTGVGDYLCARNLLLSHARAYHLYQNEYKSVQGGKVGITISVDWFGAETDSEEDEKAAELYRQGQWAIYADPIYSENGGFPKEISESIAKNSAEQGFPRSRLPELTKEEIDFIKGSSDFFGMNHYTEYWISASKYFVEHPIPSMKHDTFCGVFQDPNWTSSASDWLFLVPGSLYRSLTHVHNRYKNKLDIYVTENGWSDNGGLEDDDRIEYYNSMLESVLDAIDEGVSVKYYMAWSLMDNFEWFKGYTERFGFYNVNFENPSQRTPKKSAFVYKNILRTRTIDYDFDPGTSRAMTIDEGH